MPTFNDIKYLDNLRKKMKEFDVYYQKKEGEHEHVNYIKLLDSHLKLLQDIQNKYGDKAYSYLYQVKVLIVLVSQSCVNCLTRLQSTTKDEKVLYEIDDLKRNLIHNITSHHDVTEGFNKTSSI